VEALRDEARPDEDVELARGERVEDPLRRAAPRGASAIETAGPQPGEAVPDLALDALRPAAEVLDPRRVAAWATRGERERPAAVVAAERAAGLVEDERPFAVRAGLDVPAVAAQDDRRGPAAVDDEDRLVAAARVQRRERRGQPPRQQPAIAVPELLAGVDDLQRRRAAPR